MTKHGQDETKEKRFFFFHFFSLYFKLTRLEKEHNITMYLDVGLRVGINYTTFKRAEPSENGRINKQ